MSRRNRLQILLYTNDHTDIRDMEMNDPKPDNSHKKLDHELLFSQVIGIAAVVNGHYDCLNTFISIYFPYYSWHMPFFIFISGILFSRTGFKQSFFRLFWHKCKTLLFPALIINFFYGIISTVMRHYQFVLYGRDISLQNLFISPFLTNHQFENDVSLWFIFQLFSIELLTYGLFALIKSAVSAIIDHRADHARRTSHDYSRIRRNVP